MKDGLLHVDLDNVLCLKRKKPRKIEIGSQLLENNVIIINFNIKRALNGAVVVLSIFVLFA